MKHRPPLAGDLPADVIELAIRTPQQAGAREAFTALYRHYEPRVQHAVVLAGLKTAYLRGPEDQERRDDLTQEVWTRFLAKPELLEWYQPGRSAFGGFLWKVAYQQALYCLHRHEWAWPRVGYDLFIDEGSMDGALAMMQSDLLKRFKEMATARLDALDMMLIAEHHFGGETLRALAAKLGCGEDALQKRNKKLLAKIEQLIDELHLPPPLRAMLAILLLFLGVAP